MSELKYRKSPPKINESLLNYAHFTSLLSFGHGPPPFSDNTLCYYDPDEYSMNFSDLIWSTGHLFNCSFFRYFPYYFTYIQFLTIPLSSRREAIEHNNELWISKPTGGVSQSDNKKGASEYRPQIVAAHNGALIKIWHMNFEVSTLLWMRA